MSELKPCPFCGGEARYHIHDRFGIECIECGAGYAAVFPTKADVERAWNARAERTCELSYQTGRDNPMRGWWLCDQCGGMTDSVGGGWDGRRQRTRPPAYCARCGARNEVGE